MDTESGFLVVSLVWAGEGMGVTANGDKVSFGGDGMFCN